jgi:hypothetical protein
MMFELRSLVKLIFFSSRSINTDDLNNGRLEAFLRALRGLASLPKVIGSSN